MLRPPDNYGTFLYKGAAKCGGDLGSVAKSLRKHYYKMMIQHHCIHVCYRKTNVVKHAVAFLKLKQTILRR